MVLTPQADPDDSISRPQVAVPKDGISAMLVFYQNVVRQLLSQHDFPGVSADDIKLFRSQVGNSAFTCRVKSCHQATIGFESENLLHEHEVSHVRRFSCTFSGCHYPPFASAQALLKHGRKYHNSTPAPRSRRKPDAGKIVTRERTSAKAPEVVTPLPSLSSMMKQEIATPFETDPVPKHSPLNQLTERRTDSLQVDRFLGITDRGTHFLANPLDRSRNLPPELSDWSDWSMLNTRHFKQTLDPTTASPDNHYPSYTPYTPPVG